MEDYNMCYPNEDSKTTKKLAGNYGLKYPLIFVYSIFRRLFTLHVIFNNIAIFDNHDI